MTHLVIGMFEIRDDGMGRYCLNDFHRAAGGAAKDQPSNWMRLEATSELAEEISNSSDSMNKPILNRPGRYGGTYVVKELVYAYAMWISAADVLRIPTLDRGPQGARAAGR